MTIAIFAKLSARHKDTPKSAPSIHLPPLLSHTHEKNCRTGSARVIKEIDQPADGTKPLEGAEGKRPVAARNRPLAQPHRNKPAEGPHARWEPRRARLRLGAHKEEEEGRRPRNTGKGMTDQHAAVTELTNSSLPVNTIQTLQQCGCDAGKSLTDRGHAHDVNASVELSQRCGSRLVHPRGYTRKWQGVRGGERWAGQRLNNEIKATQPTSNQPSINLQTTSKQPANNQQTTSNLNL